MKSGYKVWVFDGREVRQVRVEGKYAGLHDGKVYINYGGIDAGHMRVVEQDLCFPTREALCEHYRKIFE